MEFLTKQAGDISKLEVTTKNGDRISASFNGFEPSDGKEEIFKSLDVMKTFLSEDSTGRAPPPAAESTSQQSKSGRSPSDLFTSKDWSLDYDSSHVDVSYGKTFEDAAAASAAGTGNQRTATVPVSSDAASLPPKKRSDKTDWNAMFSSKLTPLVEAAARARPQPLERVAVQNPQSFKMAAKPSKTGSDKKRKPRKIVPEKMEFVDTYTDSDVLLGR